MKSSTTALSTKRCWNYWGLELWTGGTSQLSLHVGAQFLGHPLSTDCVMWPEHDMASKGRLRPNPCGMGRTADPPCALPSPCPWPPTSEKLSTALSGAQHLVLPASPLWNYLAVCHFTESFIVPMANVYLSNSKTGFHLFPDACLPPPSASLQLLQKSCWCFLQAVLGSIATSHLKALPQSSRLGLLIFMSAFLSGGDMGMKERFSAGDKESASFYIMFVQLKWIQIPGGFAGEENFAKGITVSFWGYRLYRGTDSSSAQRWVLVTYVGTVLVRSTDTPEKQPELYCFRREISCKCVWSFFLREGKDGVRESFPQWSCGHV